MEIYPQYKFDDLGRKVCTKWSDSKTTVRKYWGNSNDIKAIYTIYGDTKSPREVVVDWFDKNGNIIVAYSSATGVDIKIAGFNFRDKRNLKFSVSGDNINDWKNILKKK